MPIELSPSQARKLKFDGRAREIGRRQDSRSRQDELAAALKHQANVLVVLAKTQVALSDQVAKCVEKMAEPKPEPKIAAPQPAREVGEEWEAVVTGRDQHHDIKRVSFKRIR